MPFPRALARFNRKVTNPILSRFARRIAPFGMLRHTGRTSGAEYETPIMIFRRGSIGVIALTYGPGADWVRNVLAAGECEVIVKQRSTRFIAPEIVRTPEVREFIPWLVRLALRLLRADEFLRLETAS
jgi:deazaflavin-dependent oxidoreductase (nitroreductase family)